MKKSNKVSVIIPFKDREVERLFYLYDSFNENFINNDIIEFIVVDYGSKKPLRLNKINKNRPKFKVIRSDCTIWNKAHALNIGIKNAKGDFIMTIDLDIVLPYKIDLNLEDDSFYYTSNVYRIEKQDYINKEFKLKTWNDKINYMSEMFGLATGGLQIYPKEWIKSWNGIDENLVYMGGMDNITIMMAKKDGLKIVQLPTLILHIEHDNKKEDNFNENERNLALYIKSMKRDYLNNWMINTTKNKYYGCKKPYCPMLKVWSNSFSKKNVYKIDQSKKIMVAVINNQSTLPSIFVKSLIQMFNYTLHFYPLTELRFVKTAEVSNMRNLAVKTAIENNFDYLIQLDCDHQIQENTIVKLMKHDKDFVTVPTKQRVTPFTPTQFKKFMNPIKQKGNYIFADSKPELVECEVSGPVCMLMKVEALKQLKYPYYEMGYKEKPVMSSDFMFCKKVKKAGYKIYLDKTIDCPHITTGLVHSIGKDVEIDFDRGDF